MQEGYYNKLKQLCQGFDKIFLCFFCKLKNKILNKKNAENRRFFKNCYFIVDLLLFRQIYVQACALAFNHIEEHYREGNCEEKCKQVGQGLTALYP